MLFLKKQISKEYIYYIEEKCEFSLFCKKNYFYVDTFTKSLDIKNIFDSISN